MQPSFEKQKERAAQLAASQIQPNMRLGLGSGSTASYFIQAVARLEIASSLHFVASSCASYKLAQSLGLKLLSLEDCDSLDVAVDGADAIDSQGRLLKGFGAALTREKIVASMAREFWILVDERKRKIDLPLQRIPCEILPCAYAFILLELKKRNIRAVLRMHEENKSPLITDNGGWILDLDASQCILDKTPSDKTAQNQAFSEPVSVNPASTHSTSMDLASLDLWLHSLPGLLETGLFLDFNIRLFDGSMKNQFLV